ncbi:MAG: hypothetical protein LBO69_09695 [Ignavibacteria bacterium]|jgi:hypothetical protein|nr:hypothetical protein [Ignavibacteria bacterium]
MKRHFKGNFILHFIIVLAVFTLATMYLWNWLLPHIFGLPEINFWEALGILALSKLLFSGVPWGHHNNGFGGRHHHKEMRELRNRWKNMSEEERIQHIEQMRQGRWHRKCEPKPNTEGEKE